MGLAIGMRKCLIWICGFLLSFSGGLDAQGNEAKPDILCKDAPKSAVEIVPEMVSPWIVLLCTPEGQALGPNATDEPVLWLVHNKKIPFMLYAAPHKQRKDPAFLKNFGTYPYQLRFAGFARQRLKGQFFDRFKLLFKHAFPDLTDEGIDDIVEFQALSAFRGTLYKLYLYFGDTELRHIVVCLDRCRQIVALDVLSGTALRDRIGQPPAK